MEKATKRFLIKWSLISSVVLTLAGIGAGYGLYLFITPRLPPIDSLKDVHFQVPLRVYTRDGKLIAEFGEKRRSPVVFKDVPPAMVHAFLAAEDDRFYDHPGVDYQGILRAGYLLIKTGEKAQGGSTITMQVARNFFLSREKTYFRKLSEIFLSFKIEQELTKDEILELYLNKIYMGQRAYGVNAAAQVYYGVKPHELTLAQIAMIAGLPKAPSAYNPVVNPVRATERRNYVLRRMRELGYIDDDAYQVAVAEATTAKRHGQSIEVEAPYVAEMVRQEILDMYGEDAYTSGFHVYTTVESRLQLAANAALEDGLISYTERHGYKGPEGHVDLPERPDVEAWNAGLKTINRDWVKDLRIGLVVGTEDQHAAVYLSDGRVVPIYWEDMQWARKFIDVNHVDAELKVAADALAPGDLVRVRKLSNGHWRLASVPEVQGALVSLSARDGAIQALVGGFDFEASHFNRINQAERQPGSNFKPFIYSAALEHGFTTASLINDAPVVFEDPGLEAVWRPENYTGKFYGPTRLRQGLINSRNLISIRILRDIGINRALRHVGLFGVDSAKLPRDLSLALGSGAVKPLELAKGYAVFANGGYRVKPYIVQKITSQDGEILSYSEPETVCEHCEDYITQTQEEFPDADVHEELTGTWGPPPFMVPDKIAPRGVNRQNVYLMTSIMRDVIKHGTGRRALRLGRDDLAGKTGTTNDQHDAWFSGFSPDIVTTAWVGYDDPQPLGDRETGAGAALPMWISYMEEALRGLPERELVQPPGLITVRIDPQTGYLADASNPGAIFETFRVGEVPQESSAPVLSLDADPGAPVSSGGSVSEQLF